MLKRVGLPELNVSDLCYQDLIWLKFPKLNVYLGMTLSSVVAIIIIRQHSSYNNGPSSSYYKVEVRVWSVVVRVYLDSSSCNND